MTNQIKDFRETHLKKLKTDNFTETFKNPLESSDMAQTYQVKNAEVDMDDQDDIARQIDYYGDMG